MFSIIVSGSLINHPFFNFAPVIKRFGVALSPSLFFGYQLSHSKPLCVGLELMVTLHFCPTNDIFHSAQTTDKSKHEFLVPSPVSFNSEHVDVHNQPIETMMLYNTCEKRKPFTVVCHRLFSATIHYKTTFRSIVLAA